MLLEATASGWTCPPRSGPCQHAPRAAIPGILLKGPLFTAFCTPTAPRPYRDAIILVAADDRSGGAGCAAAPWLYTAVPAETLPAELLERLILYGALTTLDGAEPAGVALALQAPDREAVDALIEDERTGLGAFSEVEIHNWEFGGRR